MRLRGCNFKVLPLFYNHRKRAWARRYAAARQLLLATVQLSRLDADARERVEALVSNWLLAVGSSQAHLPVTLSNIEGNIFRLMAMATLGIGPPREVSDRSWEVPDQALLTLTPDHRSNAIWPGVDPRASMRFFQQLKRDWMNAGDAGARAKKDLESIGIDVDGAMPDPLSGVHHIEATGRQVSWREWYRSGGRSRRRQE